MIQTRAAFPRAAETAPRGAASGMCTEVAPPAMQHPRAARLPLAGPRLAPRPSRRATGRPHPGAARRRRRPRQGHQSPPVSTPAAAIRQRIPRRRSRPGGAFGTATVRGLSAAARHPGRRRRSRGFLATCQPVWRVSAGRLCRSTAGRRPATSFAREDDLRRHCRRQADRTAMSDNWFRSHRRSVPQSHRLGADTIEDRSLGFVRPRVRQRFDATTESRMAVDRGFSRRQNALDPYQVDAGRSASASGNDRTRDGTRSPVPPDERRLRHPTGEPSIPMGRSSANRIRTNRHPGSSLVAAGRSPEPASHMKRYRPHRVPLSTGSLAVLDDARGLFGVGFRIPRTAGRAARRDVGGEGPEGGGHRGDGTGSGQASRTEREFRRHRGRQPRRQRGHGVRVVEVGIQPLQARVQPEHAERQVTPPTPCRLCAVRGSRCACRTGRLPSC